MAKYISVLNWEKYQARTDKDLPWFKLWSSFFGREWWQDLNDEHKIVPIVCLDVAKKFGNKMPKNPGYYIRNYGLKLSAEDLILVSNLLKTNGFLSDCLVELSSQTKESDLRASSLFLSQKEEKECEKREGQKEDEATPPEEPEKAPPEFNSEEAFQALWAQYPVKGRFYVAESREIFKRAVQSKEFFLRILNALGKYQAHLAVQTWKQPLNFLNWFEVWREWENREEPTQPKREKKPDPLHDVCKGTGYLPDKPNTPCWCWGYYPEKIAVSKPEESTL